MKPVSFIQPISEKKLLSAKRWFFFSVFSAVFTITLIMYINMPLLMQIKNYYFEIKKLNTVISKNQNFLSSYKKLEEQNRQLLTKQEKFTQYKNHPNTPIALFTYIANAAKEQVVINTIQINKKHISMSAQAKEIQKITNFIAQLRANKQIKKIVVTSLSKESNDNQLYQVSLTAKPVI